MSDVFLFARLGWKSIWKSNILWVFSALPLFTQLLRLFLIKPQAGVLSSIESTILLILSFTSSLIAVPYIVYRLSIEKQVSFQETIIAVTKFLGRIVGFSLLASLIFSPFLCLFIGIADLSSANAFQLSNTFILITYIFAIFSAVWNFTGLGFFAYDLNISQSIKRAWLLFTDHFIILAILGILLITIFTATSSISGMLTVLIQSSFNTTSLMNINFINPSVLLGKNILFVLLHGVFQIILIPFSASVFTSAYLKYDRIN